MQAEKWEVVKEVDSDGQESAESCDELDEILEIQFNKIRKTGLALNLNHGDDGRRVVLTQRLHREPTTRTKRAQKMHQAYCRSVGIGNRTPQSAGYVRVAGQNGKAHWTIRK